MNKVIEFFIILGTHLLDAAAAAAAAAPRGVGHFLNHDVTLDDQTRASDKSHSTSETGHRTFFLGTFRSKFLV